MAITYVVLLLYYNTVFSSMYCSSTVHITSKLQVDTVSNPWLLTCKMLPSTSSDSKLKSHFSLTNYCVPFLWPMFEDFYIQRSAILLAFQRYQKFCYYQAPFSSNFHFSDTTPTWIWAKFAKSAQILYFCIVNLAKNSVKLQLDPLFYGAYFTNALWVNSRRK